MPATENTMLKPSIDDVLALAIHEFGTGHGRRLELYRQAKAFYDRTFEVFRTPPSDRSFKTIRPGTARRLVDKAALQITLSSRRYHVTRQAPVLKKMRICRKNGR